MKSIDQISDLSGKRVFIRTDFNVPLESGRVADDTRINSSIDTIRCALRSGAKVIIGSHLGRPKGRVVSEMSLRPVANRLAELLDRSVKFVPNVVGPEVSQAVADLKSGEIMMLENLRFHPGEDSNDNALAKELAELTDVYVLDAFATAHRASASLVGIPKLVKERAAGFTVKRELEFFNQAFERPEKPVVAIFGGAKVSTKMDAIRNVGKRAQRILIGGAMANTFFVAAGLSVGRSLFEPEQVDNARAIRQELSTSGCELVLPVDVVVAEKLEAGVATKIVPVDQITSSVMALDIGPKTLESFSGALGDARTVIWNGPMGAFETREFSAGTYGVVKLLCRSKALRVVGGGDTDRALHECDALDKMSYVSTAGGAFLKLLEGAKLPAIEAIA